MFKMNKLIAVVLAVMLCATMAIAAFAETADANVAKIGETEYATLTEALAAADGNTIVLLADVDLGTEMLTIKKQVTLDLNGKTITSAYAGDYAAIYVGTAGDLTITGNGTITATAGVAIGNYGKVTVQNGTINGAEAALYNYYYNETTFGTAIVEDGELDTVWNCGDMTVNGGEIAYLDNTHKLVVTDGTITELVVGEADYAPVGGTTTDVAEGTVESTNAAARIGNVYYITFAEALAAADDNTIVLLADVDLGTEMLTIKKQVTLDLNGKTITSAYAGDYAAIYVGTAGDLTITGNGTITATAGVAIGNYGKVTVQNGTINGAEAALYNYYYNETTFGTAIVEDGELDTVWNCGDMTVNGGEIAYLDNTHKLVVTDGTITELVVGEADYAPVGGTTTDVAEGTVESTNAAARIGNVYYITFAEALAAADDNTIVLLADITLTTPVFADIDLNGYTLTGTAVGTMYMNGGTLITAEGITMAGPAEAMYITEDAVFTMAVNYDLTVISGTLTLGADWRTLPNQKVTVGQQATVIVPEGKIFTILCDVIIEGTLTNQGSIVLGEADATLAAGEGLTVTTPAGDCVIYKDGKYLVHDHNFQEGACDCGERNDLESDGDYVLLTAVVMLLLAASAVVLLNKKGFAA